MMGAEQSHKGMTAPESEEVTALKVDSGQSAARPMIPVLACKIQNEDSSLARIMAEAPPAVHLDSELMIDVVTTLEEFLGEQKKRLHPRAKAEIIVQLYELMKEREIGSMPPIARFKLVTPLLSKALSLAEEDGFPQTG